MMMFKIERSNEIFSVVSNDIYFEVYKNGVLVYTNINYEKCRSFVLGN